MNGLWRFNRQRRLALEAEDAYRRGDVQSSLDLDRAAQMSWPRCTPDALSASLPLVSARTECFIARHAPTAPLLFCPRTRTDFRVLDPEKAIIQVEFFNEATSQLAQTTLRSVLGQHDLDQMLAERAKLNDDIRKILDEQTDAWGIKVANVELKHVDINETMVRAIAKQAEAERIRRAKVIDAEGELRAAQKLAQAGQSWRSGPRRCSFATSRGCRTSPASARLQSSFRSRWTS